MHFRYPKQYCHRFCSRQLCRPLLCQHNSTSPQNNYSAYKFAVRLFLYTTFFLSSAIVNKVNAVEEPYINSIKGAQVASGNSVTVADEKFADPAAWALIQQNISVDDIVTFEINFDTSIYFFNQDFSCTLNYKIFLYGNASDTSQVTDSLTNLSLVVRHQTGSDPYKGIALYKFKGAHKYRVNITSVNSPELNPILPIFRLKTEIIVRRQYTFVNTTSDIPQYSLQGNQLNISWVPTSYQGAEIFDLEYAILDDSSEIAKRYSFFTGGPLTISSDTLNKWFANNNTRIVTSSSSHTLNLAYNSGFLIFRIRGVLIHYPDDIRYEGDWNYLAKEQGSMEEGTAIVPITWHEQNLNWQYSISFAEEGKKKEVISYFDGSFRNRQSVTLNNSDQKSIVQETIYDALGRPAVSVLPVPTTDNTIHYFKGFNRNLSGNPYSHLDLVFGSNCLTTAAQMTDTSGASKYYSTNNPFISTLFYAKHIPKADKYPFAETEYTPDNTGRIKTQGGVGEKFQLDSSHATKYFYGKPNQKELDRLFGSEAGIASHYLKNMVVDPNGQISVSYVNAGGKTVATALAGSAPPNLSSLPSNTTGASVQVSNDLMQPEDFSRNPANYSISAASTFLAPITGTYTLTYQVDPLRLEILYGQLKDSVICNNCYYDLLITVKDDCENVVSNTTVAAGNVFDTSCANPPSNLQGNINVAIDKIGDYYVTYTLKLSKDALDYYDSVHVVKNTDIKKFNDFLLDELRNADFYGCFNNCETCIDALGDSTEFLNRMKGLYLADSISFGVADSLWILDLYDSLYAHCQSLQPGCNAAKSPCAEKLDLLKLDVSPGGQYALHDSSYHLLDSATNILLNRSLINFFTDENGERDSVMVRNIDGADSVLLDVKQLNDSLFLQYWKNSWADSLVRFHPEYCYYQWCINNTSSYFFDRNVENLLDGDSAKSINLFKSNDYAALLKGDPFFNSGGNGTAFYNRMNDSLRLFSRTVLRHSVPDQNILQFIDAILYCRNQANAWDQCNPDSACRAPNREWELYKLYYLNLKQRFYELARLNDPAFANCVNCYIGSDLASTAAIYCTPPPASDFRAQILYTPSIPQGGSLQSKGGPSGTMNKMNLFAEQPLYVVDYLKGFTVKDYLLKIVFYVEDVPEDTVVVKFPAGSSSILINDLVDSLGLLGNILAVVDVLCDTTFKPFNTTSCNYSCATGIYTPYDKDSLSYYIQIGQPHQPPSGTPAGYQNWQFYSIFHVKTNLSNTCEFKNVWVGTYDSTMSVFTCPPTSFFTTNFTTPLCENGTKLSAYIHYNGPAIPPGVTVDVSISYDGSGIQWSHTATFSSGMSHYVVCSPYPISSGSVTKIITGVDCDGIASGMPSSPETRPESHCSNNPNAIKYQDKFRRFPEYINTDGLFSSILAQNPNEGSANVGSSLVQECHGVCEAQADSWISTLNKCTPDTNLLQELRNALIEICSKGCSFDRPFGASSIPDTIPATYLTFEEAIINILGLSAVNDSCAAELLANPYPYDKQPGFVNRLITETDYGICRKIGEYRTAHSSSGFSGSLHRYLQIELGRDYSLDSLELDDLLNSCLNCNGILKNDIVLPIAFEPNGKPCLVCDSAEAVLTGFNSKFPGIDTTHVNYEILFTNYFNHHLGYSLSYGAYRNFLDSCSTPSFARKLCNQSMSIEDTTSDNSCIAEIFANAITNAQMNYVVYIDSVHKDFRNAYLNRCMNVLPKLTMEADLYEYHYTLYYYDQSGNLVKTVPPAGVKLLTNLQIDSVETDRKYGRADCYRNQDEVKFENNSHYYFGNQAHLNTGSDPFSIECWIKFTNFNNQGILSFHSDSSGSYGAGYLLQVRDDSLLFRIATSATSFAEVRSTKLSTHFQTNEWLHVIVERVNDINPVRIFINGNPIALYPQSSGFSYGSNINPSAGATFKIGGSAIPSGSTHFNGSIKQVRLYKRALLLSEIRQNYFSVCQSPVSASSLAFWSAMNEGSGRITDMLRADTANYANGVLAWISNRMAVYPAHNLVTTYKYNSFNQVVEQFSPDGDTTLFWYDRLGRLTASQNMEQLNNSSYSGTSNRFSYTKYDVLGRINEVGEKSGATDIRSIEMLDSTAVKNWVASGTNRQITRTMYDVPINPLQSNITSRKRVVASIYLENASDSEGDSTLYSYDILGNVKILLQHIKSLVAVDATNGKKRIDYDFDLISGKVNKVAYQQGKGDQYFYKYLYDADNRVISAKTSRDGLIWINDASYQYHLHGPLARTELGQLKVQGLDYAYTLQGWLKGMNRFSSKRGNIDMANDGYSGGEDYHPTVSRDVRGFALHYFENDYAPLSSPFPPNYYEEPWSLENFKQLFNGNISGIYNSYPSQDNEYDNYQYDQLNRLIKKDFYTARNEFGQQTRFAEQLSYDANGNILKNFRNEWDEMDNLTYRYIPNTNKLDHVDDSVGTNSLPDIEDQDTLNYTYDRIGNLKKEVSENITNIDWTVYGKIKGIDKSIGADLTFGYDPGGNRTMKKVTESGTDNFTWYIRDAQGNVLATYAKAGSDNLRWSEQHLYGSSRVGIWHWDTTVPATPPNAGTGQPLEDSILYGKRSYEISNHLGNVLAVISDKKIGVEGSGEVAYYHAEILSSNEYYAFGMQIPSSSYSESSLKYRYGFNGKENDSEVKGEGNQQDYGMRIYDPRLGRFLSVDPYTKDYPWNTPYSFAENEPISNIDLDGLEKVKSTTSPVAAGVRQYTDEKKGQAKGLLKFVTSTEPYRNLWGYAKDWGKAVTGDKGAINRVTVKTTNGITTTSWSLANGISQPAIFVSTIYSRSAKENIQGLTYYGLKGLEFYGVYRVSSDALNYKINKTSLPAYEGNQIIQRSLRDGVKIVIADAEQTAILNARNAKATYRIGEGTTGEIIVRRDATRAEILEEAIHHEQRMIYGDDIFSDPAITNKLEIEAKDRLLTIGQKEGWTEAEIQKIRSERLAHEKASKKRK